MVDFFFNLYTGLISTRRSLEGMDWDLRETFLRVTASDGAAATGDNDADDGSAFSSTTVVYITATRQRRLRQVEPARRWYG